MYCNGNCYGLVCKSCNGDGRKPLNSAPSPIYLGPTGQIMANQVPMDRAGHMRPMPSAASSSPFLHHGFKFAAGFQRVCFGGFDNQNYLPSPLTSPALMALASSAAVAAAAAAHDQSPAGVPMGPYGHVGGEKDLNSALSPGSHAANMSAASSAFTNTLRTQLIASHGGGGNGDHHHQTSVSVSNVIPPLLAINHRYQPFGGQHSAAILSPDHNSRASSVDFSPVSNCSASGAFKPLSGKDDRFQSSAFAPPPKCPKLEPIITPHGELSNQPHLLKVEDCDKSNDRSGVATPVSTDGSESGNRSTPDEGRRLRGKKRSNFDCPCCPVCGVTVRTGELLHHFAQEVDRLQHISKSARRSVSKEGTYGNHSRHIPSPNSSRRRNSPSTSSSDIKSSSNSRWETYQRVKTNRANRLGIKACKGKRRKSCDEATAACPVCGDRLSGSQEEMNVHVEVCLRKKETLGCEEENVDIESSDKFEEYEWAGQTRVRATSLLEGGFSGAGLGSSSSSSKAKDNNEEEIDLNVDVDDSATYGIVQYSEADIIPCSSDEPKEQKQRKALRDAVLSGENAKHTISENSKWSNANSSPKDSSDKSEDSDQLSTLSSTGANDKSVVESLRRKIKELDDTAKNVDKVKCLICMEQYTNPLVSVSCWHVHCEECWLRTLGAKKLCPQCNMITSPSDLRRVYL